MGTTERYGLAVEVLRCRENNGVRMRIGLWAVGCGLWAVGCGLWAVGCGDGIISTPTINGAEPVLVQGWDGGTDAGWSALEGSATADAAEMREASQELIWRNAESWRPYSTFWNDTNINHVRHAHLAPAAAALLTFSDPGEGPDRNCSGALISRSRFVTANHCGAAPFVYLGFAHRSPFRASEVEQRLRSLGFVDGSLLTQAVQSAMESWTCSRTGQEGTRDLDYYFCPEKVFEIRPGYFVRLHPGEIFGHVDITTAVPGDDASTNNLTVNRLQFEYDQDPFHPTQVLLSPNGRRRTETSQSCSSPYTGCAATQGDDALVGSSGGVSLVGSSNRAWAVLNSATPPGPYRYTPHCWIGSKGAFGSNCNDNRHMWAPFTANTAALQYSARFSSLTATAYADQPLVGGSGGTLQTHQCLFDEAVIGIIVSRYRDEWAPDTVKPVVMGNFGVICGPMLNNAGRYLQLDHATVRTATSYDTDFDFATDSTPYPPRLNRYQSTILSTGLPFPAYQRQESLVCPSGYAVGRINALTRSNQVRAITSIECRPAFDPQLPNVQVLVSNGRMGEVEAGAALTSTSCPSGTIAGGARVRAGWFTDALGLRCRN